ncbi:unnamed protein product [Thelazia callipaeda]|uniref:Uncharacterized protein n=1 Tax=Thelazia callipaeda TaxID=103827 RepID=A0A0N5CWD7_THECL|nr:unnamed protein product [Thelazia callipaeda]
MRLISIRWWTFRWLQLQLFIRIRWTIWQQMIYRFVLFLLDTVKRNDIKLQNLKHKI